MTFTVDDIRSSLSRMVDMMAVTYGDRKDAVPAAARRCGMSTVAFKRFVDGKTKAPGIRVLNNVRDGYRRQLIEKIAEMQEELKALDTGDRAYNIWDIDLEIAALETKLKERKEGLRNGISDTGR